jgi:hypothetical protein
MAVPVAIAQQLIAEVLDRHRCQFRQPDFAEARHNVEIDVLAVLPKRTALPAVGFDLTEPVARRVGDGDAVARRDVNALTDIDPHFGMAVHRVLLAVEGLDVTAAVLVQIIDNPRFFGLAPARLPFALAH